MSDDPVTVDDAALFFEAPESSDDPKELRFVYGLGRLLAAEVRRTQARRCQTCKHEYVAGRTETRWRGCHVWKAAIPSVVVGCPSWEGHDKVLRDDE